MALSFTQPDDLVTTSACSFGLLTDHSPSAPVAPPCTFSYSGSVTATTTLASSAMLDKSNSSMATEHEGLTLEPFVPASQSTRKGRGARRRRGTPLHHIDSNPLDPILTTPDYDHFFTISTDSNVPLSDIDVIKANEQLEACLGGRPKKLTELRSGGLLVEVASLHQSQRILNLKTLDTATVTVSPHSSLNQCKGTIFFPNRPQYSDEQLLTHLRQFKVVHVHRQHRRVNGVLIPTPVYVLTFSVCRLPEAVSIGWIRCPVRLYIPLPRRCFKCQRFGHGATTCRSTISVCAYCSHEPAHEHPCPQPPRCANCDNDHPSFSKDCVHFKFEREVVALQTRERLSYHEAKRLVKSTYHPGGVTYAAAAAPVTCCEPLCLLTPTVTTVRTVSSPLNIEAPALPLSQDIESSVLTSSATHLQDSRKTSRHSTHSTVPHASSLSVKHSPAPHRSSLSRSSSTSSTVSVATRSSSSLKVTPSCSSSKPVTVRSTSSKTPTTTTSVTSSKHHSKRRDSFKTLTPPSGASQKKRPADGSLDRPPISKPRTSLLTDYPMPPGLPTHLPPPHSISSTSIPVIQGGRFASLHDLSAVEDSS